MAESNGRHFSYAQLMGLWIRNGGSKAKAPIAAAIAEAESSGWSAVTSANPDGGQNVGPWQLDTKGKGAGYTVEQLQDPATNAHVAVTASRDGNDWSAWETYVSGAYKQFLSGSTTADMSVPGGGGNAQPAQATVTAYSPGECALSFPGLDIPVLGNVGQFCLVPKSSVRGALGVGLIIGAALTGFSGLSFLAVAAGMKALGPAGGAAARAGGMVALIPGAEGVGLGLAAAGHAAQQPEQAARRRRARRASTTPAASPGQASPGPDEPPQGRRDAT